MLKFIKKNNLVKIFWYWVSVSFLFTLSYFVDKNYYIKKTLPPICKGDVCLEIPIIIPSILEQVIILTFILAIILTAATKKWWLGLSILIFIIVIYISNTIAFIFLPHIIAIAMAMSIVLVVSLSVHLNNKYFHWKFLWIVPYVLVLIFFGALQFVPDDASQGKQDAISGEYKGRAPSYNYKAQSDEYDLAYYIAKGDPNLCWQANVNNWSKCHKELSGSDNVLMETTLEQASLIVNDLIEDGNYNEDRDGFWKEIINCPNNGFFKCLKPICESTYMSIFACRVKGWQTVR